MPEVAWSWSLDSVEKAELMIVIGTSLQVYPVNQLSHLTDGRTVLINVEKTGEEHRVDLFLLGRAAESKLL